MNKEAMKLRLDFNNMMANLIGEHGISEEDFAKL